jgi:predicted permease
MFWRRNRRSREDDLERELRDHLALEAEEQQDPYAARRALGNAALIKENVRESWGWTWLERLAQDLRYACRGIRQSPGFAAAAVLSLALGIGANTAIFGLIDAVRLRTLPVPKPQELGRIQVRDGIKGWGVSNGDYSLTTPLFQQIRDHQQAFSGVFAWSSDGLFPVGPGLQARMARGLLVSGAYFDLLGIRAAAGRLFTPDDDHTGCADPGVVLSYGMWQSEFGGKNSAIGNRLTILDRRFEVIGVAPEYFTGLDVGKSFDFALPVCAQGVLDRDSTTRRDVFWLTVMGRLKPGWSIGQASDHLRSVSPGLMEATLPSGYTTGYLQRYLQFQLTATPAGTGVSDLRYYYQTPLWLLLGLTTLVLLIASANVANLMLARASSRSREFAVRLALGASRARLLRQSLCESALLAFAGAVCGVGLAQVLSRTIVSFLSTENNTVFLDLGVDWRVLGFTAAVAVGACLLFGLTPAIRALRVEAGVVLQSAGRSSAGNYRFSAQRSLIVGQVALSLVLVVSALLFIRSFRNLVTLDPGFREAGIVEANFNLRPLNLTRATVKPSQRELLQEIRSVPGVETAATTTFRLLEGGSWTLAVDANSARNYSKFTWVSPGYFETLGIPILAGRDFDANDREESPKTAIVNQTFAHQFFPAENPVGKTFRTVAEPNYPEAQYQIVAVSKDTKYSSLREETPPMIYAPASQFPETVPFLNVFIRSSVSLEAITSAVKGRLSESHPQVIAQFREYKAQIQSGLTRERMMAMLSGFFGALAAALAAIGLYGVIAYIVVRRQGEIGIRMALGADRRRVIAMVMKDVAVLVAIGVVAGVAGALALVKTAQSLLFGLSANDPGTFVAAGLMLMLVAALGSFAPARRASRVDPLTALRCE